MTNPQIKKNIVFTYCPKNWKKIIKVLTVELESEDDNNNNTKKNEILTNCNSFQWELRIFGVRTSIWYTLLFNYEKKEGWF